MALAAVPALASVAAAPPAAAAEPTTIVSNDFESGYAPWAARGSATLTLTADEHHGGAKALAVTDRTANWMGAQFGAAGLFEPGATYTFSAWVKLPAGTAGTTGMHFTAEQTPADGSGATYSWIGSPVDVTADAWVQIGGTYTYPTGLSGANLYVEAATLAGAEPSFLVDDVLVTGTPVAPAVTTVTSLTFDDSTTGDWTQSGGPTLGYRDQPEGGKALVVGGITHDYDGIQSPAGIFTPGTAYTFSMRARLDDGTAGAASVRLVMKPSYTWVANATVTAAEWTTIQGTWTAPADTADPTTLQVYLGSDGVPTPFTLLVDDLVITAPGGGTGLPDGFVPGGAINPTTTPVSAAQPQGTADVAALTFDDGPNPATTPALLDFLKANHIKATFCVIGQNIQASDAAAALLRRIVAEGHTLCNHSTSYDDLGSATPAQAQATMLANLQAIRTALGDPFAKVPFWRAPNGSWGATAAVAVKLGMQPLAVVNTIDDWETQDVATLTANLQASMKAGQIVLCHDGGGDRSGTLAAVQAVVAQRLAAGWAFTLPVGAPPVVGDIVSTGFEDGTLDGWAVRNGTDGSTATVAVTSADAHGGTYSARVATRSSEGDGIGRDVSSLVVPGATYAFDAWVKFPTAPGAMTLSAHVDAGSNQYPNLFQIDAPAANTWTEVSGTFTMPDFASVATIYLETKYQGGVLSDFLVDDIRLSVPEPTTVQDVTPIKDTLDFPVGAAVSSGQLSGSKGQLLARHFDQVTPENFMKPEAWYDANHQFVAVNAEADALMTYAQQHSMRVYGHNLVWYQQTPDWFFQDAQGAWLTNSPADQAILTQRLNDHVDNVAKYLSDKFGKFGSATNPIVAFDVVNEVVSDNAGDPQGLRQSHWYQVLGDSYITAAFARAEQDFNHTYAATGAQRPVALFVNDYNTEQSGKRGRLLDLVDRLIAAGAPVDGVGHQFHVTMSTPISSLKDALDAFAGRTSQGHPLYQAVTELDVPTGTPVTTANLIDQGYYYRDLFDMLRAAQAAHGDIYSVTVWGLTDDQSWRNDAGAPLLFDAGLQAKPAYYGVTDQQLPAKKRSAIVFAQGPSDVDVTSPGATSAVEWAQLSLHPVEANAGFQLRWSGDHLTAFVTVSDATVQATDAVAFAWGASPAATATVGRDGVVTGTGVTAQVASTSTGWKAVVDLPIALTAAATPGFDVAVTDGSSTADWNTPGNLGTLQLVEALSSTRIPQAPSAPTIDGAMDAVWAAGSTVTTAKTTSGAAGGATATVHQLWRDHYLYLLAEVTDPTIDTTPPNPYEQDSLEVFVDPGNAKNGSYRPDDAQMRINVDNVASFGTGDEAAQQARLTSATARTATGYVVEARIDLLGYAGVGTFQGVDYQVNDGTAGARTSVHNWAEPTGTGYQTTARWGVAQLVGPQPPVPAEGLTDANRGPVDLPDVVRQGDSVTVDLGRQHAGETVDVWLYSDPVQLPSVVASKKGVVTITVPSDTVTGAHRIALFTTRRALLGWDGVTVIGAHDAALNTAPPVITGTPAQGKVLRATVGTWAPAAGLRFAYQWQRDGAAIRGADGPAYTVQKADVGHALTVVVTATAKGFPAASATSQPVTVTRPPKPGPPGWHWNWHHLAKHWPAPGWGWHRF